ncbi:5-carboxymethyl-2-hydroxymuconate delta isomerase [Bradyrhizobiaceae bacterium SG-6C]|nr:5-carboxymethyl-2-hydroxymuconate delta isomerase [Bradyrhizobiaceae bacterium SG-6C]
MPHIVCHYSATPDMPPMREVMQAIHEAAAATGIVKAEDLKIRALPFTDYLVAGEQRSFFHVALYLLAGRTPAQKEHLSTELRKSLAGILVSVHSISIDIRDMDPQAYKKRLLDT